MKPSPPPVPISVAISTRNRATALARCLEALAQGTAWPAEVVIVDQSSDDQTRQLAEQQQSGLPDVPIVYLHQQGNGLGRAQNLAIASSTQPIVAVTDDDCVPPPEWLATIMGVFASDQQIDAVTGRVLPLGPPEAGRYPVSSRTGTTRIDFDRRAMPWNIGSGNNFAVKRDWLLRIGSNNEQLGPGSPGLGGVDMDLFYRLLCAGARIRYDPDVLVYHEQTTRAGRLSRRVPYGFGMGAAWSSWVRLGQAPVGRVLVRWLLLRFSLAARALRLRNGQAVYEELLIVWGTLRGIVYGFSRRSP